MKIKVQKSFKTKVGILIVPLFKERVKKISSRYPKTIVNFLKKRISNKELSGKKGEMLCTYPDDKNLPEKLLILGMGKSENLGGRRVREIFGKLGKYLKSEKHDKIAIELPGEMNEFVSELLEGMRCAQYHIHQYKSEEKMKPLNYELEEVVFVTEEKSKKIEKQAQKSALICKAVFYVRDLVNAPSSMVNAEYFEKEAKEIARKNKYKIAVFNKKELRKMGWGGLLAVNQGSKDEPKCVVLHYEGASNKREKPIALVGKGIIFDSGGYNLKPTNHIETMQQDMAGAAIVLATFRVLKEMGVKKNVIGIMPLTENLISQTAYKPSDIITMYNGMTVEITNTDAEGRLVLADGITYARKFKPEALISIATLTGAVSTALGDRYAGLVGNNLKLRGQLQRAGREMDDLMWPLPLHRDFKKKMDSKVADIRNADTGTSRLAGCSKGAAFLERFVGEKNWCHVDIGGTSFTEDPKKYETKGATGHGVRMMLRFLEKC